jgi:hypothetical protein
MSNTNTEQAIVSAKANVMIYDDMNKKWNPSGQTGQPGLAKVHIYQNILNQSYRVVGRKIQDQEVVINCLLTKGIKYNQANATFLQWRDSKQVYGLHFQSKDEADVFSQTMKLAIENLNRLAQQQINNLDNISVGKRSISSDYYEDQQQIQQSYNNVVNGISRLNNQQTILSPPLSTSSSSSSSSSSSNGGLSISINNNNNNNNNSNIQNVNGNNNYSQHLNRQISDSSNFNYNGGHLNQFNQSVQQQPLYQSSPIPAPPPPPPPPLPMNLFNMNNNNNNNSDNSSQKIYDTIPDTATYPISNMSNGNNGPPPPPPLPNGLLNGSAPPPPPPPLPINLSSSTLPTNNNSNSNNNMMNELTKSIQASRQLKKVDIEPTPPTSRQTAPPQLDFLTEIRQKLEKKNKQQQQQQQQQSSSSSSSSINGANHDDHCDSGINMTKPSSAVNNIINQRKQSNASLTNNNNTNNKYGQMNGNGTNGSHNNINGNDSPKTIKKITSTPNVINTNGNVNGYGSSNTNSNNSISSSDYDRLKQELIVEFRKELQNFKSDIINCKWFLFYFIKFYHFFSYIQLI